MLKHHKNSFVSLGESEKITFTVFSILTFMIVQLRNSWLTFSCFYTLFYHQVNMMKKVHVKQIYMYNIKKTSHGMFSAKNTNLFTMSDNKHDLFSEAI